MKPRGFSFGILYGKSKVHKQLVDNCPPLRPTMSVIKTCTYNLAKFQVPVLGLITTSMYTVNNSFEFATEIVGQDLELFMASMNVESLFTHIPLEETLSMCCDSLFSNYARLNNINWIDFEKLFRPAQSNNFFNFEGKVYKQIDEVAMGSPLGPTLANAFLCFHEQIWLNVLMNSNLYTTEDTLMTFFYFVHLIILIN